MNTAVAYLRVSTKGQGSSGLGVDAQREAVERYCRENSHRVIAEFVEIESGSTKLRPGLRDAIDRAKGTHSLLVIARLDRLSRSVRFIAELLDADVRFVAVDIPSANRLVLHILAAVAEEEARVCSIRTKAALAAAKARGVVLGTNNLPAGACYDGARAANIVKRRKRDATIATIAKRVSYLRNIEGFGYRAIASTLNAEDYRTVRGKRWRAIGVWRVIQHLRRRGMVA